MKFNIVIAKWLSPEHKAYLYDTFGNPPMIEAEDAEAAQEVLRSAVEVMNRIIGYPAIRSDKFILPLNPQFDFRNWLNRMQTAAEEWRKSNQRLLEESNKMEEAIDKLLEEKDKADKMLQDIKSRAKHNDPDKCMGNNQPICQRCNRLSYGKGGMIPEAKLGKCKNFQNKRR